MHEFDFRFDFKGWSDGQIERLFTLLEEVGEYQKRDALLGYLYPPREEVITVIDVNGRQSIVTEIVRS